MRRGLTDYHTVPQTMFRGSTERRNAKAEAAVYSVHGSTGVRVGGVFKGHCMSRVENVHE